MKTMSLIRSVLLLALTGFVSAVFADGTVTFEIGGEVESTCELDYDCGSRCTNLNLEVVTQLQDTADISLVCNFTRDQDITVQFTVQSSNGGFLTNGQENIPYNVTFDGSGDVTGDIATGLIVTYPVTAGSESTRMMQVQLIDPASIEGIYLDLITATVTVH